MPRKYTLKNPYFKNARIDESQTIAMIFMFLRGIKSSRAAKEVGISQPSANKIYKKLREMVVESGFGVDFSEILYEREYMLWTLFHAMRCFLINVDLPYDAELEEYLKDEPEQVQMLSGVAGYGVTYDQLRSCIYRCDTETPPLIVRKMANSGDLEKVIEKRLACKSCPLKLLEFYKPSSNSENYYPFEDKSFTFEPHYKYKEDKRDLVILWVEVLNFLADYRNIEDKEFRYYAMQGVISRMLKRAEYKVKNVVYGNEVPSIFLEDDQKAEIEKGFTYQSKLDAEVLGAILKRLRRNPI